MFAFEPFLALGLEFPFEFAADCVDGVEAAAITAEIYDSIFHRRRRRHPDPGKELPFLRAGVEIDGV